MRSTTISLGPHRLGFISFASLVIPLALASCSRYDGELSEGDDSYESALGDSESDASDSSSTSDTGVTPPTGTGADDDSGSPCVDPCPEEGALACEDDGVILCADDDGDGCLAWSEPDPCGDDQVCEEGACLIEASDHFEPPAPWSVPTGGTMAGGFSSALGVPAGVGDDHWSLLDINGDHRLDLVVTARAVNKQGYAWFSRTMGYPNAPYWEVYVGEADGFADTPIAWPVPSEGRQDHGLIHHEGTPKVAGDAFWSLRDLDGDERPDLVITGRAYGDGDWFGRAIGYPNTPYWEVYLNEGDGFADTPTNWRLPQGGPADRGYFVADGEPASLGDPKWEVRDLDDDGYPDLVLTGKALSIVDNGFLVRALGSLESPYWEIYRGTEKGFSDTPEAWMIPPGGTKTGGFARGESTPEKIGDDCWRLRDLDGNGLDDLIVTARASEINGSDWEGKVPGFPQSPHWVIYENTGDGFRRTASQWPVPVGGFGGQGFIDIDGQALNPGDQSWETFDLDGDGHLELVVTSAWEEGQTPICRGQVLGFADGEPRWDVFETTERGFTTNAWRFSVPAAGLQLCGLRATAGQPIKNGDTAWFTTKFDPDHYPDLLMTGVGLGDPPVQEVLGFEDEPHWQVYRGRP